MILNDIIRIITQHDILVMTFGNIKQSGPGQTLGLEFGLWMEVESRISRQL